MMQTLEQRMPFKNSYAKFLLWQKGIYIYDGDKRIFALPESYKTNKLVQDYFSLQHQKPTIKIGSYQKSESIIIITSIPALNIAGFYMRKPVKKFSKSGYTLTTDKNDAESQPKTMPKEITVLYDEAYQKARMMYNGIHPLTGWIMKKRPDNAKIDNPDIMNEQTFFIKMFGREPYEWEIRKKKLIINDLIVGITPDGRAACIPHDLADVPRIGIVGKTGTGKSLLIHAMIDQLYHYHNSVCCYLNDVKFENYFWTEKNNSDEFKKILSYVGLIPLPLPSIFLSPNVKDDLKSKHTFGNGQGIHLYFSIAFADFLKKIEHFSKHEKHLRMGATQIFMQEFYDRLILCKTKEEINVILNELPDKGRIGDMKWKLKRILDTFLNNEIIDIEIDAPSYLKIQREVTGRIIDSMTLPTIPALLHSGIMVNIASENINNIMIGGKSFQPQYYDFLVGQIYDLKREGKYFAGKQIFIAVDEFGEIIENRAVDAINIIATRGRSDNIGLIWADQYYTRVLKYAPAVAKNTDYMFLLNTMKNEAHAVLTACNQKNKYTEHLAANLNVGGRKFEALLISDNSPIIFYDLSNGEKKIENGGCYKIRCCPPLSRHKKGSEEIFSD